MKLSGEIRTAGSLWGTTDWVGVSDATEPAALGRLAALADRSAEALRT